MLQTFPNDLLLLIHDALSDALFPASAVAFSSTAKGLRQAMLATSTVQCSQHKAAKLLCRSLSLDCAGLHAARVLRVYALIMDEEGAATLGAIVATNGLPHLKWLRIQREPSSIVRSRWIWNEPSEEDTAYSEPGSEEEAPVLPDALVGLLFAGAHRHSLPMLRSLQIVNSSFGALSGKALATALARGAMPNLEEVALIRNPACGDGIGALAPQLRRAAKLTTLELHGCGLGDAGLQSLLGTPKDTEWRVLRELRLGRNMCRDWSPLHLAVATAMLETDVLYELETLEIDHEPVNGWQAAAERVHARRAEREASGDRERAERERHRLERETEYDEYE